jgi:hypothetical protein
MENKIKINFPEILDTGEKLSIIAHTQREGRVMSNTLDTVILTNNCTCADEETESGIECYGYCYEDSMNILSMVLKNWREMNSDATDALRIEGEMMTWERLSGYAIVDVSGDLTDALVNALRLNGDYTLVFKVSHEGNLSVVRYSHDEPTGAGFSVNFVPEELLLV